MEADVAAELDALRSEIAALKGQQDNWRQNGLGTMLSSRGVAVGFGAAKLGPWGVQISSGDVQGLGGSTGTITPGGTGSTLNPYPGIYLNTTFDRTPSGAYPYGVLYSPSTGLGVYLAHHYGSTGRKAFVQVEGTSAGGAVSLVANRTLSSLVDDMMFVVRSDASGNIFDMSWNGGGLPCDGLILPILSADPTSTYGTTDGNLFYRSDTDTLRLRVNGAWVNVYPQTSGGPMGAFSPLIPGRMTAPADVTISSNTTLTERFNYFKNLTISNSATLTGLAGGTIIVVEETLTIGSGCTISVNGLGGKGAPNTTGAGTGGWGGGGWGRALTTALTATQGVYISSGAISASNPAKELILQANMPAGGAGGAGAGANAGSNGTAFPADLTIFGDSTTLPTQWELIRLCEQLLLADSIDNSTTGAIGGGGGGAGGQNSGAGAAGAAGTVGCRAGTGGGTGAGGGGGSGIGGGGGGGGSASGGGASGAGGGRGGGVLILLCGTLNNSGTISANGAVGSAPGGSNGGGGGGGGGGLVAVGYHALTALGTVQASGGTGGTGAGTSGNGGTGGAGIAQSFKIRSGA